MTHAKLLALLGTWGKPPDVPAKIALAMAVVLTVTALVGRGLPLDERGDVALRTRRFLSVSALVAALLSVAYTAIYLRGGPRIVDATTYWLEGRALVEGGLRFEVPFPSASFRGRFLLHGADDTLAGIFPPGEPLLLALGFALRAPMIVGPLLAGGLVVATHRLARALAAEIAPAASVEPVARTAALLSVVCATLRYHTADTMAHGATALAIAFALERALAASRAGVSEESAQRAALAVGAAIGAVVATRPVSALAVAVVAVALLPRRAPLLRRVVLAALPGVLVLAWAQHAATGSWLTSSQRLYYAIADGPEGCFRWGLGAGVGCRYEHGEFVHARLEGGYGVVAAIGTTLRRLHLHLADVANLEPLALLALAPVPARRLQARGTKAALALVALHVVAYAPFYFDGNYPGGGARLLADVLPIEHALVATAVVGVVVQRASRRPGEDVHRSVVRASAALLALALVGFSVHGAHAHEALAFRDGGRPMFEPDVVARARVTNGLVFVDTDHGFDLAHVPGATTTTGVVYARLRDDDHDGMLYERLGRPPTWLYKRGFEERGAAPVPATVTPFTPNLLGLTLRFESEADWPPLAQSGGFAAPAWTDACAGGARALVLTPDAATIAMGRVAKATIALPVPYPARYRVTPRIVHGARVPFTVAAGTPSRGVVRIAGHAFTWSERPPTTQLPSCEELPAAELVLEAPATHPEVPLAIEAEGGPVALDRVTLERLL